MVKTMTLNSGNMLDEEQVRKAVRALQSYVKEESKNNLTAAMDDHDAIQLQFTFKKVPTQKNVTVKIALPNSLVHETTEICLFVKDLDQKQRDYQPTVSHIKKLLSKNGIKSISQIFPLKAIKLEYQPYEARRNLSNMFDVFLADARVIRLLPELLGKSFYGRKRFPIQVNLNAINLKKEFDKALTTTLCILSGRGSSGLVKVSHCGLDEDKSVENILAVAEKLFESLPGGPKNIKKIHLKTPHSLALPVYVNDEDEEIVLPKRKRKQDFLDDLEEVSTIMGAKVRVTPSGVIQIVQDGEEDLPPKEKKEKRVGRKKSKKAKQTLMANKALNKKSIKDGKKKSKEPVADEDVEENMVEDLQNLADVDPELFSDTTADSDQSDNDEVPIPQAKRVKLAKSPSKKPKEKKVKQKTSPKERISTEKRKSVTPKKGKISKKVKNN